MKSDSVEAAASSRSDQMQSVDLRVAAGFELVSQGAEARVYAFDFDGRPAVVKERFQKLYRHPVLEDKLSSRRLVHEVRSMARAAKAGVRVPTVYYVDKKRKRIVMERLTGVTAKTFICSREGVDINDSSTPAAQLRAACDKIGHAIATLHGAKLIHGDLTTSNMFVHGEDEVRVAVIDFGLGQAQASIEDMAVDLYVLERAFSSTHPDSEGHFSRILSAYEAHGKTIDKFDVSGVLKRLSAVRARGRKKLAFG